MRGKKCAVKNCDSHSDKYPDMAFFMFPKTTALSSLWLLNINNPDLSSKSFTAIRSLYTVCAKHFEDKYFQTIERKS